MTLDSHPFQEVMQELSDTIDVDLAEEADWLEGGGFPYFEQTQFSAGPGVSNVKNEYEDITGSRRVPDEKPAGSSQPLKRRRTNWREEEKTILAGLTMTYYGVKHSLKESRAEKECCKDTGSKVSLAWQRIYRQYEKARIRWNILYNDNLIQRTENALSKKWKDGGSKAVEANLLTSQENELPKTTSRFLQFLSVYNKDFILTCNQNKFDELFLQRQSQENVNPATS